MSNRTRMRAAEKEQDAKHRAARVSRVLDGKSEVHRLLLVCALSWMRRELGAEKGTDTFCVLCEDVDTATGESAGELEGQPARA
jgi:hypothetical protein